MLKAEYRLQLKVIKPYESWYGEVMHLLYAPLLSMHAIQLYETLYALSKHAQWIKTHALFPSILQCSMNKIEESRMELERFSLLKTYYHGVKNAYLYVLYPPKQGSAFLAHEVFGRMYFQKVGKQCYDAMKLCFAGEEEISQEYQNISDTMQHFQSEWNEQLEDAFQMQKVKPENHIEGFQFSLFLQNLSPLLLPNSERTKDNLEFIAEKALFYGVDEKKMQQFVGKSIDLKTNRLNRKRLIHHLQNAQNTLVKALEDPYQLPPVHFLQQKQHGVRVSKTDQILLEHIKEDYHFSNEVINALVEYVLAQCNQKLSRSYVDKVASSWVRLQIDTLEKALQACKQPAFIPKTKQISQEKELPEWYYNQDSITSDEEEFDEDQLLANLQRLGEKHE